MIYVTTTTIATDTSVPLGVSRSHTTIIAITRFSMDGYDLSVPNSTAVTVKAVALLVEVSI